MLQLAGSGRVRRRFDAGARYVDDRLFDAEIDGGPVAWLHDEFVLEVRADQAERAAEILKQSMIDGFAETFPGAPLNGLIELHTGRAGAKRKGNRK